MGEVNLAYLDHHLGWTGTLMTLHFVSPGVLWKILSSLVTLTEADFLKTRQTVSPNTLSGLVNKVWFDIQLHMEKAKEGSHQLDPESFVICKEESGLKYSQAGI